jgi:uncharacterized Zn finger protein
MAPRYRVEDDDYDWPRYVTAAERRRKAEQEAAKLGQTVPVVIEGSQIARTFWGKSWCANLERYSDFRNRLPRGRSYVRNGCVLDLRIERGAVNALVSGSSVYRVQVKITPIPAQRWKAVCRDCAGAIDSLVELLEGRFSEETMERLCREGTGMFPLPSEMRFTCSCPDSARMCKHVAAVLYGIGARLDKKPELLFELREVDQEDLIAHAGAHTPRPEGGRVLTSSNLSELFGIDIIDRPKRRKRPKL